LSSFVRHRPLGDEHPYAVSPDQRTPPRPRSGDSIAINAVTHPEGAARRVWVTVDADGNGEERTVPCKCKGAAESEVTGPEGHLIAGDAAAWGADLGTCVAAQLTYTISAEFENGVQTSGPHTVELPEVLALPCVETIVASETALQIDYLPCGRKGSHFRQLVHLQANGAMRISLAETAALASPMGVSAAVLYGRDGVGHTPGQGTVELRLGEFSVEVETRLGLLCIRKAGNSVLLEECRSPEVVPVPDTDLIEVTRYLTSPAEEAFFGLGERFHAFDQRGWRVDTSVFEQWCKQGLRSYIPVPFVVSSRGYGLWAETSRPCVFDLAATQESVASVQCTDRCVSLQLFAGNPQELVRAFTALTGRAPTPPSWVFGPWMSSNEWNSQERLEREVNTTLDHDIPATVVVVEAWSDEQTFYIWNDATVQSRRADEAIQYDDLKLDQKGKWPDPREMIERIHDLGIRLFLWQVPVIKDLVSDHEQHSRDQSYVEEQRLCVLEEDGTPYRIRPGWFKGGMVIDFSNPDAREWWFKKRRYLIEECGVDGFKTDGGEHLWGDRLQFANGKRGDEMINAYPVEYLGAYHSAMTEWGRDSVTFSRSGYTGVQRFPVHWAGDQESTWEEFRAVYRAVLNAGLAGIGILGWDLAGFAGDVPTAELYQRSASCTAFSPIMQYHSDFNHHRSPCNDRSPWNIAERTGDAGVLSTYRKYAHLRMRLIPYLHAEAANCSKTGDPLMAPIFYYHPNERQAWSIADQHFLGRSLLVAPVLSEGIARRTVYLPEGEWLDVWTGELIVGPTRIDRGVPPETIAVYLNQAAPWPYSGLEIFQNLPEDD